MSENSKSFAYIIPEKKTYDWGSEGTRGITGRYWMNVLKQRSQTQEFQPKENYAEIWFGTHPKGMNYYIDTNDKLQPLSHLVSQFTENKDDTAATTPSSKTYLPYLLKILSASEPLSLQAHPDRATAKSLHEKFPDLYPDTNHKPEVSLILSPDAEMLCGFRPWAEIHFFINKLDGLSLIFDKAWVAQHAKEWNENVSREMASPLIQEVFSKATKTSNDVLPHVLHQLCQQISSELQNVENNDALLRNAYRTFLTLYKKHKDDVGCLSPFFIRIIQLKDGDCMFIPENTVHAYLHGEMIECMANSDNVIRGGLTTKHKDLDTLLATLNYTPEQGRLIQPVKFSKSDRGSCIMLFDTGLQDFKIYIVRLCPGDIIQKFKLTSIAPAIFVVLTGAGTVTISREQTPTETASNMVQGQSVMIHPKAILSFENCNKLSSLAWAPSSRFFTDNHLTNNSDEFTGVLVMGE